MQSLLSGSFIICLTSHERLFILSKVGALQVLSCPTNGDGLTSSCKVSCLIDFDTIFTNYRNCRNADNVMSENINNQEVSSFSSICASRISNEILVTSKDGCSIVSIRLPKCLISPFVFEILSISEVNILLRCLGGKIQKVSKNCSEMGMLSKKNKDHKSNTPWKRSDFGSLRVSRVLHSNAEIKKHDMPGRDEYMEILRPTLTFATDHGKIMTDQSRKNIATECLWKLTHLLMIFNAGGANEATTNGISKSAQSKLMRYLVRKFQTAFGILLKLKEYHDIGEIVIGWISELTIFSIKTSTAFPLRFLLKFINQIALNITTKLALVKEGLIWKVIFPMVKCLNILVANGVPCKRVLMSYASIYHLILKSKHEKDSSLEYLDTIFFLQQILQAHGKSLAEEHYNHKGTVASRPSHSATTSLNWLQGQRKRSLHSWKRRFSRHLQKCNLPNTQSKYSSTFDSMLNTMLLTNNYDAICHVLAWIDNQKKISADVIMNISSIFCQRICKKLAMAVELSSPYQTQLTQVSTTSDYPFYLTNVIVKLLISQGKLQEASQFILLHKESWKWQLFFSFLHDYLNKNSSLESKFRGLLEKTFCNEFNKLPIDIVQQLTVMFSLFPGATKPVLNQIENILKTMRHQINEIPFFNDKSESTNENLIKRLKENVSSTLTLILALRHSYDKRKIIIKPKAAKNLELAYETCENVDYLLDLRMRILEKFDLQNVASSSAIAMTLEEGLKLIRELKLYFPNMWNDDLCMLVMSTVQYQLLPNINSADHIVYHHEDLSSIPKYRIQLNQLLEFKWNQIILPSSNFSGSEKKYMGSETLSLSDYVTKRVLQNPKREPKNQSKRKGFNKLCEKYIYSAFDDTIIIKSGTNGWFESSPDSSFSLGCNAKHERPETKVKTQPRALQLRYVNTKLILQNWQFH